MSGIPWPIVALLVILMISMSQGNWLYVQYRELRDRWDRRSYHIQRSLTSYPTFLVLAITACLTAVPMSRDQLWPWSIVTSGNALANPPVSMMLKGAVGLVTLLTFSATAMSAIARDQHSGPIYMGKNIHTASYSWTMAAAILSTWIFQLAVAWVVVAPFASQYMSHREVNKFAVRLIVARWSASFAVVAATLTLNVLTILYLSARRVRSSSYPRADIAWDRQRSYRAGHAELLRRRNHHDASEASGHQTVQIVELIRRAEDQDEQRKLLAITINSQFRWLDFHDACDRVVKTSRHPRSRFIRSLRLPSPAVLNGILDGRRDTLIRAATDADLPGPTRSSLLHRVLQDVQDADALIRDLLEADAALTEPMMGRTTTSDKAPRVRADEFSGLLTLKDDDPWSSSRSLTRRAEADESRYLERVPLAAYRELAKQITGHPCRLTSAQVKAILNSRFISETFPHGDSPWGMLHDRTAATARSIIIEALLSATITNRAGDETLPLSTVRDLMGWERGVDHDLLDEAEQQDTPSLRAEVRMRAQHRLQLTPILTPAEHAELLGYSSSATVSLTALLHMLLYYGRSGRAVRGEDLAPFYKQIHRELRFRDSFPADAVEHTSDVLRVSHVSHIVAPDDVAWLYDVVKEPLTCNTFTELDHHRAAGLDLSVTNLCLWWAIVNPGERARRIGLAMPDTLDSRGQRRLIDAVGRAVQILDETHIDNLMGIASWLRDELPEPYDEDDTGR
ncbi:hypothetical protein [Actinomyces radicidentis]|nr:hypothetical protein [Actinomyces radicidentis]